MSIADKAAELVKGAAVLPLILKRLTDIAGHLARLAELYQADLEQQGRRVLPRIEEPDKGEVTYTDEMYDAAREIADAMGVKKIDDERKVTNGPDHD